MGGIGGEEEGGVVVGVADVGAVVGVTATGARMEVGAVEWVVENPLQILEVVGVAELLGAPPAVGVVYFVGAPLVGVPPPAVGVPAAASLS